MRFYFHTCLKCGRVIAPERLEVLPETRICIKCARKDGSDIIIPKRQLGMDLDTYKDLLGAIRS